MSEQGIKVISATPWQKLPVKLAKKGITQMAQAIVSYNGNAPVTEHIGLKGHRWFTNAGVEVSLGNQ